MVSIRLAYDISVLGTFFSRPDSKTGIFRVTEEILNHLVCRSDIKTTLICLCGEDIVFASVGSQEYLRLRQSCADMSFRTINFQSTYKSRLKIEWLYDSLFRRYFSQRFQEKSKLSLESLIVRGSLKALQKTNFFTFDTFRTFNSQEFDLLHSSYHKLPSKELTKDLPRLIMIHDLIPIKATEFVAKGLDTYFCKILNSIDPKTDWVVCNSEYTRQEFCEYTKFPLKKTFVTPLGVDKSFYPVQDKDTIQSAKIKYGIPEESYFLCLASQLEPRKNILHLVESFINLIRENPNLQINLILAGSLRHRREELDRARQIYPKFGQRIILTGYVSDNDLVSLYSGATAFIFPSLYEGFGMPLLEAMQSGVPVISSNATSLPEVAGDAAILIHPKDKDALCQAMINIINDQSLRSQLIQKGFAQASKFSWERCTQETVEIYKEIMSK